MIRGKKLLLFEAESERRNQILVEIWVPQLGELRGLFFFYRPSIGALTQHLQPPVTVNEEGTVKDLGWLKGWKE